MKTFLKTVLFLCAEEVALSKSVLQGISQGIQAEVSPRDPTQPFSQPSGWASSVMAPVFNIQLN